MNAALGRIGLGLFVAIAAVVSLLMSGDGPPPDDADLMTLPAPVSDAQNAFISLSAAAELVRWPEADAESERWTELARGESWDDALAARALAENAQALETFARAARQGSFQSPPIRDVASDVVPDGLPWIQLARLSGIRSIAAARAGDGAGALDAGLAPLRLAQQVSADPNGALLSGMTGLSIGAAGFDALAASLPAIAATPELAREAATRLSALHIEPEGWRAMWASEYRTTRASYVTADPAAILAEHPSLAWLSRALPASYLYQPNKSLAANATRIRARQAAAGAACTPSDVQETARVGSPGVSTWSLLLPNGAGRLAAAGESLPQFDVRRCLHDTRLEMLRGAIGLLAFERDRNSLPPALDALVPAYLESAPRDWFAEESLRLDRRKRLIYSLGSDGVDERGREPAGQPGDATESREPRLLVPELARAD